MRRFIFSTAAALVFMLVFGWKLKFYDLATGAIFAWGLGLMARGRVGAFLALFPIACLNRETTVLLIIIFGLYYFGRLEVWRWLAGLAWQAAVWGGVRWWLMALYDSNTGVDALIRPLENLQEFAANPFLSVLHWGALAWIGWRVVRGWRLVPELWRCAVLALFPSLLGMYLVLGWAFEVRVFAEGYALMVGFLVVRD